MFEGSFFSPRDQVIPHKSWTHTHRWNRYLPRWRFFPLQCNGTHAKQTQWNKSWTEILWEVRLQRRSTHILIWPAPRFLMLSGQISSENSERLQLFSLLLHPCMLEPGLQSFPGVCVHIQWNVGQTLKCMSGEQKAWWSAETRGGENVKITGGAALTETAPSWRHAATLLVR